mmetsp:Transcript_40960/g.95638  ORF Transcript_40960/g.95638 Transcript_40960/m.95638 type:complete len:227 (-) Transcript_40960:314-994(-)
MFRHSAGRGSTEPLRTPRPAPVQLAVRTARSGSAGPGLRCSDRRSGPSNAEPAVADPPPSRFDRHPPARHAPPRCRDAPVCVPPSETVGRRRNRPWPEDAPQRGRSRPCTAAAPDPPSTSSAVGRHAPRSPPPAPDPPERDARDSILTGTWRRRRRALWPPRHRTRRRDLAGAAWNAALQSFEHPRRPSHLTRPSSVDPQRHCCRCPLQKTYGPLAGTSRPRPGSG